MITELRKEILNLANQRNGPLANLLAKGVQMTYAVDSVLQVWMALLETILEDTLDVCKI
jgi:hypothetical protein